MIWNQKELDVLLSNPSNKEVAKITGRTYDAVRLKRKSLKETEDLHQDSTQFVERIEKTSTKKLYKKALEENERLKREIKSVLEIRQQPKTFTISKKREQREEATAIIVASDWHVDEVVDPAVVSGLNKFNPEIAKKRVENLFRNALRLIEIEQRASDIHNIVLALLGDFISNTIHEELQESNSLLPTDAIILAQRLIASGIEMLLKHTKCNITIPCHSGNHGRMTKKVRHSTEAGNSLERYMYYNLSLYFRNEKRVKFLIAEGYHSYMELYGYKLRFHHGHAMRYGGGVGGIYIPINKAIAQWNKAKRVDWDFFAHFHQLKDGGNFICNGSIIGYNAFALSIKADYEDPKQAFFVIHSKKGRLGYSPIFVKE